MSDKRIVGYMEGTDPELLTQLICDGFDTMPFGNGADGHGMNITIMTQKDAHVLVGYLHKFMPPKGFSISLESLLFNLSIQRIPLVLLVPESAKEKAKELMKDVKCEYYIVDPSEAYAKIKEILSK